MNETFFQSARNDPPELSAVARVTIRFAGADPDYVIRKCPQDISNLMASGTIAIGSFVFNAADFAAIGSHLVGHFSLPVLAGGVALAGYVSAADTYNYFRCGYIASGVEQMALVGLPVSLPRKVRTRIRRALATRIVQSISVSLIVSVMSCLIIFADDTRARIRHDELQAKAGVIQQLAEQDSSELKRLNSDINSATTNIASLSKQINTRLARPANAANSAQVKELEATKATEESKLAREKAELSQVTSRLRSGLSTEPPRLQVGVLTELNTLEQIGSENWSMMFLIILVAAIATACDLAPVLAKMNWLPTTYARLKAEEFLKGLDETAERMVTPEPPAVQSRRAGMPANDNKSAGPGRAANDNLPLMPPVKRRRGRPRKHPLVVTNGSGRPVTPKD